ncbi:type I toxin-antitoxin system Fst family toxin [Enterococcus faecalis]
MFHVPLFMFEKLISLVIAPLLVGLVLLLVDRWLDD